MPIARGVDWGEPGALPPDGIVVADDAEARAVVTDHRRRGVAVPPIGLLGGDLCRTLGGRGDRRRLHSPEALQVPVDLGSVLIDGRLHWFVAHLIARRSWLRGRLFLAMNAEWLGDWRVAPRAHPGDGLLDVIDGSPPIGQRLHARRRLPAGDHLPHPDLSVRQVRAVQADLDPRTRVWLDGQPCGPARQLSVRVEPDALLIVV